MSRIGDRDRDRAATALRRHYLQGRLSVEEFSERLELALRARSDRELGPVLRDLPAPWQNLHEVVGPAAKAAKHTVARAGILLALLTFWALFSLVLLVAFGIALLVDGPSTVEVFGFPLVWVAATYGLWRFWQHTGARRA
jgi:Flp pilus assembly protein TadB